MANEISASASLSATKNGASVANAVTLSVQASKDMAGDQMLSNVQAVGTSWEALLLGDVSTIGFVLLKNLDETNFVEIALANDESGKFIKLLAGDIALYPASTATMYAKADTSGCNLWVQAIER